MSEQSVEDRVLFIFLFCDTKTSNKAMHVFMSLLISSIINCVIWIAEIETRSSNFSEVMQPDRKKTTTIRKERERANTRWKGEKKSEQGSGPFIDWLAAKMKWRLVKREACAVNTEWRERRTGTYEGDVLKFMYSIEQEIEVLPSYCISLLLCSASFAVTNNQAHI